MPRALSELYVPSESPVSQTSTGTANIVTFTPSKRAIGVYVTVETNAARVTFDGTAPGAATGPGIVIQKDSAPVFFPFSVGPSGSPLVLKAAANLAGNSLISVIFVQ